MIDPAFWRDGDSESARLGFTVSAHVLSLFLWRRCYRFRWWGPWTTGHTHLMTNHEDQYADH